ncbi:DtxR family transcriptional regulator, partial [bacterium]|nr:DtxR family transcriptional regulator [bacterium]
MGSMLALAVALVALGALLGLVFGRRAGALTATLSSRRRRVLLEDALKHLHDVEYRGLHASVESLAGAVEVPGDLAVSVVAALEAEGLIERSGASLRLTEEGRSHARRIVRIHRLWEKWLAERTGVDKTRWHALAEKKEHRTSDEEAAALASRLGHPAWDPHGDPIPTPEGEMPPRRGKPLPAMAPGEWAVIEHLEDEPAALYGELVRAGLHPGMRVRLEERSPSRLVLVADGRELELSPVAAANVTVEPLADEAAFDAEAGSEVLSTLEPGQSARVIGIAAACVGAERRRLLDLGLVPGTQVTSVMTSASGNPT